MDSSCSSNDISPNPAGISLNHVTSAVPSQADPTTLTLFTPAGSTSTVHVEGNPSSNSTVVIANNTNQPSASITARDHQPIVRERVKVKGKHTAYFLYIISGIFGCIIKVGRSRCTIYDDYATADNDEATNDMIIDRAKKRIRSRYQTPYGNILNMKIFLLYGKHKSLTMDKREMLFHDIVITSYLNS
jgi:hypothetical protein